MNFSKALEELKNGKRLKRSGWNASNQYIYLVPEGSYPPTTDIAKAEFNGENVPYSAYFAIKSVQGIVVPWLASQTDLLAEDWETISE